MNSPAKTTAFSGEKRPLRSFQGAFSWIMGMDPIVGLRRFKPRWLYGGPRRLFHSAPTLARAGAATYSAARRPNGASGFSAAASGAPLGHRRARKGHDSVACRRV